MHTLKVYIGIKDVKESIDSLKKRTLINIPYDKIAFEMSENNLQVGKTLAMVNMSKTLCVKLVKNNKKNMRIYTEYAKHLNDTAHDYFLDYEIIIV